MGEIFYKVDIIFPKILLYYQHSFPPLREMQYAAALKLFAETSELVTHVGQHVPVAKLRPQSATDRATKNMEGGGR